MPFGVSPAQFLFTKLFRPLLVRWRASGIVCYIYLDDIIILNNIAAGLRRNVLPVVSDLWNCGFVLSNDKCILEPVQHLEYLGFEIDTRTLCVSVPIKKPEKVLERLGQALTSFPFMTARNVLKVAGSLVSLRPVFGSTCLLRTRTLFRFSGRTEQWDEQFLADKEVEEELKFWVCEIARSKNKRFLAALISVH